VFGLKQKDGSSLFDFNLASVYNIKEALAKQKGLEYSARKGAVGVVLICSHRRIVLEAMIG
jgi:hypothetical protein